MTVQASFNPRNGLVVPAPASDTPELADEETALGLPRLTGELAGAARALRFYGSVAAGEAMAGAGVTTGPFGIVHGFDAEPGW